MSFQSIIERARGILLAPRETWPAIAAEPVSASAIFSGWVLWFAAIGPLARLIGWTAFGFWTPFAALGHMHVAFAYSLAQAVLTFVLALAMVLIMAFIVDLLAASFGGTRNFSQALKTVAYAYTPAWIVAILGLMPALAVLLAVAGLLAAGYSIYLLYVGLPFTMKCPQDRSAAYAAVSVVIAVILSVVLSAAIAAAIGMLWLRSSGMAGDVSSLSAPLHAGSGAGITVPAWGEGGHGSATGGNPGNGPVTAVTVDQLKPFLPPTLNGYARSHLTANRVAVGSTQYSEVEAIYKDPAGHAVDVKVEDLGSMRFMAAIAANTQFETQSSHGYNRSMIVDGMPASERWYGPTQNGHYVVYVAGRFLVQAKGSPTSMATLETFVRAVDLKDLAALK